MASSSNRNMPKKKFERTINQKRNFIFPGTSSEIELNLYRTPEDVIKNSEIIIPELKSCFDSLMTLFRDCLESKEKIIDSDKYNVYVGSSKIELLHVPFDIEEKILDYGKEKVIYTLTPEEVKKVGDVVVTAIDDFMRMFLDYYVNKCKEIENGSSDTKTNLQIGALNVDFGTGN